MIGNNFQVMSLAYISGHRTFMDWPEMTAKDIGLEIYNE